MEKFCMTSFMDGPPVHRHHVLPAQPLRAVPPRRQHLLPLHADTDGPGMDFYHEIVICMSIQLVYRFHVIPKSMNLKIDLGIVIGAQLPDRPHDVVHVSLLRRGRHHGEAGLRGLEAPQER